MTIKLFHGRLGEDENRPLLPAVLFSKPLSGKFVKTFGVGIGWLTHEWFIAISLRKGK